MDVPVEKKPVVDGGYEVGAEYDVEPASTDEAVMATGTCAQRLRVRSYGRGPHLARSAW